MSVITLTTDFGTGDWFVGTMKGVIAGLAPDARVIDLSHKVPPGNIRSGAFDLAAAAPYFPDGTIHVAVVDPGVGSARGAIAIRTPRATFVGPDNGVLSWAVREEPVEEVRLLENSDWLLQPVSQTFHGRDVFAPAAARLAAGASFTDAGGIVEQFVQLPWPSVRQTESRLEGEIVHVDRFGNAISNLSAEDLPDEALTSGDLQLRCADRTVALHHCYADVPRGKPLAIMGSSGLIEFAINGGDFADHFGVGDGAGATAWW